jgi:putative heme-binding domain-containing protein
LAYCLRSVAWEFGEEDLLAFLSWSQEARTWQGGASFGGYLKAIIDGALDQVEVSLKTRHKPAIDKALLEAPPARLPLPGAKRDHGRTLAYLLNTLGDPRRDLQSGARVFSKSCAACHRFQDQGVAYAPDLSQVRGRMDTHDLLQAIAQPSKDISDQYRGVSIFTTDSDLVSGLVIEENDKEVIVLDRLGERHVVQKSIIDERRIESNSAMPEGLLDAYSLEEVSDLFAYLKRGETVQKEQESAWTPLFAEGLTGWRGEPDLWQVEQGVLKGESIGLLRTSYLQSEATYGDFALQLEVHVVAGNSGVQLRSQPTGVGFGMRGLQADLGETYWGSLYDEGGIGMAVQASSVEYEPTLDRNGFNHLLVEAVGDQVRVTLNGVPTAVYRDPGERSGHLGFQLHQGDRTSILIRRALIKRL